MFRKPSQSLGYWKSANFITFSRPRWDLAARCHVDVGSVEAQLADFSVNQLTEEYPQRYEILSTVYSIIRPSGWYASVYIGGNTKSASCTAVHLYNTVVAGLLFKHRSNLSSARIFISYLYLVRKKAIVMRFFRRSLWCNKLRFSSSVIHILNSEKKMYPLLTSAWSNELFSASFVPRIFRKSAFFHTRA
jgi:hypothetical protein